MSLRRTEVRPVSTLSMDCSREPSISRLSGAMTSGKSYWAVSLFSCSAASPRLSMKRSASDRIVSSRTASR
ncbi:hypothetical protein D3C71_2201530 [compost metagenome]